MQKSVWISWRLPLGLIFCIFFILFKRKHQICEEVPQRRHSDGENLAEVEVPFQLIGENVKC